MRRIVPKVVSALLVLAASALALAVPAFAGDRAVPEFIGFSEDGRYFAFEEYGIQDGSGFAYSTVYVLDLDAGKPVDGSPFAARGEDEDASLADIREDARDDAEDTLEDLGITQPAIIAALIGDGVADPGTSLTFGGPGYGEPGAPLGEFTLELTTFPTPSEQPCTDYTDQPALGFALNLKSDAGSKEIYRDTLIADARFCPLAHRLYAVVVPYYTAAVERAVAIVSSYPLGFEGPDRRFVAVPVKP